jgi:hypothetical protein
MTTRKRLFLMNLLLMAVANGAMAQQTGEPRNPLLGYVITNTNDTIQGTIDYLTGKENAEACHFLKDGETAYRTYRPGEIQGYRVNEGGAYYVSRTLPLDGKDSTFFAEYLLQGGVSLYRYEDEKRTLFYMVDGKGKVATIKKEDYEKYKKEEAARRKRNNLQEAAAIMYISPEATRDLWQKNITAANLVRTTRRYNEQYCQDAGDCVEFQYNSNKTSLYSPRLFAEVGFSKGEMKYEVYSFQTQMPYINIGCEFGSSRKHPNLSHQATVLVGLYDDRTIFWGYSYDEKKKFWLEVDYGLIYRFPTSGKNRPFVNGGITLSQVSGAYAAAGYEFGVGRHLWRVGAKFNYRGVNIVKDLLFEDDMFATFTTGSLNLTFVL